MRGDRLDRQWQVIRAIEAVSKGLAMFENAGPDETQGCGQNRNPIEACSKSWDRLFLLWGAQAVSGQFFGWPGLIGKGNKVKLSNSPLPVHFLREPER